MIKNWITRYTCQTIFFVVGIGLSLNVFAQTWPAKPIKIIIPFAAGGVTDVVIRTITPKLSEALGQPIVIDNRGGAAGAIACEIVAKAAPDGYTVLLAATNNFTINQFLYKDLGFDPLKRLDPVTVLVDVPSVLFVPASVAD
jgi:tripartite-type tricarboxylate transporter receptor subunit TctC